MAKKKKAAAAAAGNKKQAIRTVDIDGEDEDIVVVASKPKSKNKRKDAAGSPSQQQHQQQNQDFAPAVVLAADSGAPVDQQQQQPQIHKLQPKPQQSIPGINLDINDQEDQLQSSQEWEELKAPASASVGVQDIHNNRQPSASASLPAPTTPAPKQPPQQFPAYITSDYSSPERGLFSPQQSQSSAAAAHSQDDFEDSLLSLAGHSSVLNLNRHRLLAGNSLAGRPSAPSSSSPTWTAGAASSSPSGLDFGTGDLLGGHEYAGVGLANDVHGADGVDGDDEVGEGSPADTPEARRARLLARRDVFQARLQCRKDLSLGLLVQDGVWGENIVVRSVRPKGAVAEWNSRQAAGAPRIQPGDVVHSVDDQVVLGEKYNRARRVLIAATTGLKPFTLTMIRGTEPPPGGRLQLEPSEASEREAAARFAAILANPQLAELEPQTPEPFPLTPFNLASLVSGPSSTAAASSRQAGNGQVSATAGGIGADLGEILDAESAIAAIRSSTNALLSLSVQPEEPSGDDAGCSRQLEQPAAVPQEAELGFASKPLAVPETGVFRMPLGVVFTHGDAYRVSTVRMELGQAVLEFHPSSRLDNRLRVHRPPVFREHSRQPGDLLIQVSEKLFALTKVYRLRRPNAQVFATARRVASQDRGGYAYRVYRGSDYSDETGVLLWRTLGDVRGHNFLVANGRGQFVAAVFPRGRDEYCVRAARGVDVGMLLTCVALFEESPSMLSYPHQPLLLDAKGPAEHAAVSHQILAAATPSAAASGGREDPAVSAESVDHDDGDEPLPDRVRRISI